MPGGGQEVYGSGVKAVDIVYRLGRKNVGADAPLRSPCHPSPVVGIAEGEGQVASVATKDIGLLLQADPVISEQSDYFM